jgi:polar amino acid transport system substrate-binding protein
MRLSPWATCSRHLALPGVALALAGYAVFPTDPHEGAKAELSSTGKMRAAVVLGNPILASRGPDDAPQDVSIDLAREVARRLHLPLELVTFDSAGATVAAMQAHPADLACVAIEPVRGAARTWPTRRPT